MTHCSSRRVPVSSAFATGFALLLAATAPAQTTPPAPPPSGDPKSGPLVLEAFTVTGSNIRRVDEERTLPVTVIDADDLAAFAAPTASELLSLLPNGGVIALDEGNILGADARGDNVSINLRGIGSGNTLVLLNGRRLAPHPISQSDGGVPSLYVNINQLPTAAVKRVEVLRDGASAIYGADAAAGVVNTLLRRDYQGFETSLRGAVFEHGGAGDWRATLSGGESFNGGRTNLLAMIDYYHRDFLGTRDRKFSRDSDVRRTANLPPPWNGVQVQLPTGALATADNDFDNRSSASNYGNFIRGSFNAAGNFTGARPTGNAGITTSTTPSTTLTSSTAGAFFLVPLASGGTGFRQTTPSRNQDNAEKDYYYNLAEHRTLFPKTDRVNFFGAVDHQLNRNLSAFGELAYYRADSWLTRDPAGTDGADDFNLYVSANNPWNPFGSRFYHPTGAPNADGTPRITGTPSDVLIAGSTGVRPREFKA